MRQIRGALWAALVLVAAALQAGPATGEESVVLAACHPKDKVLRYKHNYTLDYQSNFAELIDPSTSGRGMIRVVDYGQWTTAERVVPVEARPDEKVPANQIAVRAKVERAESQPSLGSVALTAKNFPHTLENIKEREFSWRVTGRDSISAFKGEFPQYVVSRADIVTDMFLNWMPELYPVLPEKPVAVGATWTGSRTFQMPYAQFSEKPALCASTSTYKLKGIVEKKGRRVAVVDEQRKVEYQRWIFVNPVTILVSGEGEAKGEWTIDLEQQVVESHKIQMKMKRPAVMTTNDKKTHEQIRAQFSFDYKAELEQTEP